MDTDSERHEILYAIVSRALALPIGERRAFLDEACAPHPGLREEVDELLEHEDETLAWSPEVEAMASTALQNEGGATAEQRLRHERALEITGLLGSGGMGQVVSARDPALEREVAVKLLHPRLKQHPEALQRFIREAKIGGRLQHPGIVQVYECGLEADPPYFVMKRVEGQTFRALLRARQAPGDDLSRHVDVFLQVCRAMAYAHDQGIVHRDLKPANFILGSFGAVQVADWGLAKVLVAPGGEDSGSTADWTELEDELLAAEGVSLPGAVMGTPGYMSPEQARGEIENIDRRTDVFALGSVLAEILTGTPAYPGDTPTALEDARKGDLSRIHERLESCGAPEDLIRLALDCLAVDREKRPQNAGEVARRVEEHLSSVEAQLQLARMAAHEERARTAAAQRTRRLTIALAVTIVLSVCVGTLAYVQAERTRAERLRETTARAQSALSKASELERRAQDDGGRDLARFDAALLAAEQAVTFCTDAESDELITSAAGLRDEIVWSRERLAARLEQERRDQEVVAELLEAREQELGSAVHALAQLQRYRKILKGAGVDVLGDVDEVVEHVRTSAVRRELLTILDHCLLLERELEDVLDVGIIGNRLLPIARRVDPSELHAEIRECLVNSDVERLIELANVLDPAAERSVTIHLLARSLEHFGESERAIELYERGCFHHPSDFWLALDAAGTTWESHVPQSGDDRLELARRFARTAVALRPDAAVAWNLLGLCSTGDDSIAAFRRALSVNPEATAAVLNLSTRLHRGGDLEGAERLLRGLLETHGEAVPVLVNLGTLLTDKGETAEAIELHRRALEFDPTSAKAHYNLSNALFIEGELEASRDALHDTLEHDPDMHRAHLGLGMVLRRLKDLDGAREHLKQARERLPEEPLVFQELRRLYTSVGELPQAVQALQRYLELAPPAASHPRYKIRTDGVLLCLAIRDEEHLARARQWFTADLDDMEAMVAAGEREWVQERLEMLRKSAPFARVAPEQNDELPEAEREPWRQIWKRMDALLEE